MSNNFPEIQPTFEGNLFLQSESQVLGNSLMLKDRWYGEKDLGIRVHQHRSNRSIYFGNIKQLWLKNAAKRHILYKLLQKKSFSTLLSSTNSIQCFACFLDSQCIRRFEDITNEVIDAFIRELNCFSQAYKHTIIVDIKIFLETGNINSWFNVPTYVFSGKACRYKPGSKKINYIPDEILSQLDEHLHFLPNPVQRMVVLIRALGLRGGELLQMRFDCLRQGRNEDWVIQFINWKFNEQVDTLPINETLATLIQEQQAYIKTHLGNEYPFLFCGNKATGGKYAGEIFRFKPTPKVMKLQSFTNYLNNLAKYCSICDLSGNIWSFTTHQFRRTVATKMTNEGVRQYVIQMYLRHQNPDMMLHYAHLLPATMKAEIKTFHKQNKLVDVTGAEVEILHPELDNDIGLQWLRSRMQPKALAMGFCSRPELLKPCPHANACLSCKHYRLDSDDLPALNQHLNRTRKLKAESERLGYVRQVQGIEQDEAKLIYLIKSLKDENE